jgi:collagenase-like PrtC family protease
VAARTRADAYTKEDLEEAAQMTAEAGVHATLALAAVTAEVATVTGGVRGSTATAWREAGAW